MADTSLTPSFLRINNIELRVPPKNISIIKQDYNAAASTLRSQTSTFVKSGRRTISIIVDTYFSTGYNALSDRDEDSTSWVNSELAPLILQARKCPFVSIENEKIRNEIVGKEIERKGIQEASNNANMAVIIKQIDIESKTREPGMFYVRLHLEWFNYSPFSTDFAFKEVDESERVTPLDVPGNQFEKFIESGTVSEGSIGSVNSMPIDDNNDLEIIYKEYRRIDIERFKFDEEIEALTNFEIDKSEEINIPFRAEESKYDEILSELRSQGWELEDELQAVKEEPGRIVYRYRSYKIKDIEPDERLDSGRLLVESARISLQTKTASIPLLGHTIPTAQFLGAADGNVIFNIFANADLENEEPISTSSQLSDLNKIIELININAVRFRRIAKNDSIFVKHPMAKLLKYKPYDEQKLTAVDESGKLLSFNPREYLSCIVQSTESHTVDGLPFCSRFSFVMTENYRSKVSNVKATNSGASGRIYDATKELVKALIDKYDIQPNQNEEGRKVVINQGNNLIPLTDPDFFIAEKIRSYLSAAISIKNFSDSKDAIDDPAFIDKTNREVDKEWREKNNVSNFDNAIGLAPRDRAAIRQRNKDIIDSKPLSSNRLNEVAWDILKVALRGEDGDKKFARYKESIDEFKAFNLTVEESNYPDMMLPDQTLQPDFFFFNASDQSGNRNKRRVIESVIQRYKDSAANFAEEILDEAAAKKISEDMRGSKGPPLAASNLVAVGEKKERGEKEKFDKPFTQAVLDQEQQNGNIQTAVDNFASNTYTMRRSMPTFKLFIKEGDLGSLSDIDKSRLGRLSSSGLWRNFTDFYDINSIVDIRLVKDKHNPADTLVVRMTNTKEDIINKAYEDTTSKLEGTKSKIQRTRPKGSETEGRERKADINELDGVMLKEGTRIELRLGYEGDPNHLSIEFSGRVAQVGGGDIVEILCQGDGIELVQELKGVGIADEFTFNSNTQNLISELLHNSPEIKNLGTINTKTSLGDLGFFWRSAGGRTAVENIFAPTLFGSWQNFGAKTTKYSGLASTIVGTLGGAIGTAAGGVGAIPGSAIGTALGAVLGGAIGIAADIKDATYSLFKGSKFIIYEQTVWDVLQELTLRHPGTICDVVNFDRRSTIFFGYPDQLYFNRGPTFEEAIIMGGDEDLRGTAGTTERTLQEGLIAKTGTHNVSKSFSKKEIRTNVKNFAKGKLIQKTVVLPSGRVLRQSSDDAELTQATAVKEGEAMLALMKQYRSYHMVTSEHDIIENGMKVNSDDVYNSIQIVHPEDSDDSNSDGSVGFAEYKKTDEIKADDDLNNDYIKRQTLVFHNAHKDISGLDLPEQYAVSSLCKSLCNVYKGRIKILGRPGLKPYDIVFIYDSYNSIYGPVEVENVIHTFSYATGWVTEFTPNMIVTPTTTTGVSHINAMQRLVHSFYLRDIKLFYSGALFNNQGQLTNGLDGESSFLKKSASSFAANATTGLAISGSAVLAQRGVVDGASKLKAAKRLQNVKNVSKLGLISKGAKFGLGRLFGSSLPIVGDLMINYAMGAYASWSKFRQPIIFLPVTRNGKPWYTGLYGLNNNTEVDAIKGLGKDILKKGDFFLDYIRKEFPEVFD